MSDRPLFDPSRIHVPASELGPPSTSPNALSVRQVNELVRGAVNRHLPATLHVLGELADFSRSASGHSYFTLKDSSSELRCVMWRSAAIKLSFVPTDGLQVIASGGVEVYAPRGSYQLVVRGLEPRGVGALELAFRQLRDKLAREGLLDPARKRKLPAIPRRVGVVTSLSGAALRDILQTLARRFAALEVLVFPTRVQGVGAAQEIAASVTRMNRHAAALGGIDVAIVGRGGGSLEDLWAFNEEVVARAVVQSAIPIVSAVGHEIDVSICDLVADLRAATPTAAAEMIVPNQAQLISELQRQAGRAGRAARYSFERATTRLQQRTIREPLARPLQRLNERAQLLDDALLRMQRANQEQTRAQRERLVRVETALLRFAAGARFVQLARRAERSGRRLREALFELLRGLERQIARRLATLQRSAPAVRLGRVQEHQLQSLTRLRLAFGRLLAQRREALATRLAAVQACDPRRVLARGYSITRELRSGRVLRSLKDVREAQRIEVELADGRFRATADDPRQPSLFDTLRSD